MKSRYLQLNWRDAFEGFVIAMISTILTCIYQVIEAGQAFDWPTIKHSFILGVGAGILFLLRNFFKNSTGASGPEHQNNL